jgi:hypothetical protein
MAPKTKKAHADKELTEEEQEAQDAHNQLIKRAVSRGVSILLKVQHCTRKQSVLHRNTLDCCR